MLLSKGRWSYLRGGHTGMIGSICDIITERNQIVVSLITRCHSYSKLANHGDNSEKTNKKKVTCITRN